MPNESLLELAVKDGKENVARALKSLTDLCFTERRNLWAFEDERMIPATADLEARFDELEEAADQLRQAWQELQYSKQGASSDGE